MEFGEHDVGLSKSLVLDAQVPPAIDYHLYVTVTGPSQHEYAVVHSQNFSLVNLSAVLPPPSVFEAHFASDGSYVMGKLDVPSDRFTLTLTQTLTLTRTRTLSLTLTSTLTSTLTLNSERQADMSGNDRLTITEIQSGLEGSYPHDSVSASPTSHPLSLAVSRLDLSRFCAMVHRC